MGELVEVEHFLPTEIDRIRPGDFDLHLVIDDGLRYEWRRDLGPAAWWVIDTHLDPDWATQRGPEFDRVFAAQKDGAERLRRAGIASATWLPLACDPLLHGRQEVPHEFDVAFVGNIFPGPRHDLLEEIVRRYPQSFVGNRYFDEMARTYSAAKIAFNRSLKNDINMRVFEGLASGALLVTNDLSENGQAELFSPGQHLVTYQSAEELFEKLEYYLRHDAERERIAAAGRAEVLERHTYRHRMQRMLETISASRTTSVAVPALPSTRQPGKRATPVAAPVQDAAYFDFARPEVAALVPPAAKNILDIGCGAGRLGESLKGRPGVLVTGIELRADAAESARQRLDAVHVGSVEDSSVDFPTGSFDCVICADVLEHLRDPAAVLQKIRRWLTPEGTFVASLPNVQHHTLIASLLEGNWTYESAGLLDETHLRFFTRREIEKLLYRTGFRVTKLGQVHGEGHAEWQRQGSPAQVRIGSLGVQTSSPRAALELFTYQYLVTAVPDTAATESRPATDPASGLARLAAAYPWARERPDVPLPLKHRGWLADGVRQMLARELHSETRLVLELGAWLGLSTRRIADLAPQAKVITVDHWEGSPEHHAKPQWRELLPRLYDLFLNLSWDYRDRIQPLKMTTQAGLVNVAACGLQPDLIFIDADHRHDAVAADLETALRLFPQATLIGDDYDDPGVQQAVKECAALHGLDVELAGEEWRAWKLVDRQRVSQVPAPADHGLTSIILVTHNELAYTRLCLDSLRRRTDEPYELIVVDNGSTDGTVEWLRGCADVRLIENAENRGFPAAVNQGLAVAKGRQLLLLNNDTLLTTGWLRRLLAALHAEPKIGLVGPVSNNVAGYQQIDVSYRQLESLDGFAWDWGKQNHGLRQPVDKLIGFCLLFRREVLEQIGTLDERFGIGCYEDDDFCRRAIQSGWKTVVARDAFVHHFGSRTFQGSGADLGTIMDENGRKFAEKWNPAKPQSKLPEPRPTDVQNQSKTPDPGDVPTAPANSRFVLDTAGSDGLRLRRVHLSACLIVRDNENTIRPCLESLRPWVDELIVVDTGSKDRTPEIALEYGARLFHFPWCDDFSAARNESLKPARGEWIFWMDSDDTLPAECGRQLRELANGPHSPETFGYIMQVHCPGGSGDSRRHDVTIVDHVKLFRNRPDLRFEGKIHEQILPAIRRAAGEVQFTDVYVVHSGSDHSAEGKARKLDRDLRILHRELEERPRHPFVLFNLGMTYADAKDYDRAAESLRQSIAVAQPGESHLRKAYALLVSSLSQAERHEAAWDACTEGLGHFPDDKELLFRAALLHHHFGRLEQAAETYLQVLQPATERHFASVDQGLCGFKARQNLALVYQDLGDPDRALEHWRKITQEVPHYPPGWQGLAELLLEQHRVAEVQALVEQLRLRPDLAETAAWLAARLAQFRGDLSAALPLLEAALAKHPESLPLHELRCHLLFDHRSPEETETALLDLLHHHPDHPAALHNLGAVYLRRGCPEAAQIVLQRSLALRPLSPVTRELWNQACLVGPPVQVSSEDGHASASCAAVIPGGGHPGEA